MHYGRIHIKLLVKWGGAEVSSIGKESVHGKVTGCHLCNTMFAYACINRCINILKINITFLINGRVCALHKKKVSQ